MPGACMGHSWWAGPAGTTLVHKTRTWKQDPSNWQNRRVQLGHRVWRYVVASVYRFEQRNHGVLLPYYISLRPCLLRCHLCFLLNKRLNKQQQQQQQSWTMHIMPLPLIQELQQRENSCNYCTLIWEMERESWHIKEVSLKCIRLLVVVVAS